MREITFRGKRLDNGEWVHGNLKRDTYDKNDFETGEFYEIDGHPVYETTIGQFTGLYDAEYVPIYEGDIVQFGESILNVVEFRHGAFGYMAYEEFIPFGGNTNFRFNPFDTDSRHWVIGDIYDNPELLTQ